MKFVGYVTVRLNSKRVPNKSILKLGGKTLIHRCISTLNAVEDINETIVYCSQPLEKYIDTKYTYVERNKKFNSDDATFNDILDSIIVSIDAEYIVFMCCTSPFITAETIQDMIDKIETKKYDSAFAATSHNIFTWYNNKPLNYNPSNVPKTQDLMPVLLETSGLYIFSKQDYIKNKRRIGKNPYIKIVDMFEGWDIDTPDDLEMAKIITEVVFNK